MDFDIAAFRLRYPQFASYSDEQILAFAEDAKCHLSTHCKDCRRLWWFLMVAHLLTLDTNSKNGGAVGQVTSASIDKISVSIQAPTATNKWSYWLSLTPYGLELLALLSRCFTGGFYVGGRPERAGFRAVGGRYPNGGRSWRSK